MRKYGRILALAMAAVMTFSLTGCRKQEAENTQTPVGEYTWVPEYIELAGGEDSHINLYNAVLQGDSLYYATYKYDEEKGTSTQVFSEFSLKEQKVLRKFTLGGEGGEQEHRSINMFYPMEDGGIITVENLYVEDKQSVFLCSYDTAGSRVMEKDISAELDDGSDWGVYVDEMMVDAEGRIYLSSQQKILLYDRECKEQGIITLDDWVNGMGIGKDGKVYVTYYDNTSSNGSYCLGEVDFNGKKIANTYQNYPNGNSGMAAGIEKDFLMSSSSQVFEYDIKSQTCETLFQWLDSDINGDYVEQIATLEDGRLVALISDWESGESSIALLQKTKTSELPAKEQIVIGTIGYGQELRAMAVKFNKENPGYHVTLKSYLDENSWDEDSYTQAITNLNNDITSGSCPDILDLGSLSGKEKSLSQKGVFEDLTPYLEKSSLINKEDYLQNILEFYTYDGKLVGIPKTFNLQTIVGRASEVGDKPGWTVQEMIAYAKEHPDAALFDYASKYSILQYLIAYNQDAFIDYDSGKCSFDSDEFKEILSFVAGFPDEFQWGEDDASTPVKIGNGEVLLESVYISDFESIQPYEAMYGEPVTYIGYPNSQGSNGCMLRMNGAYAISAKSSHKDGAWLFLESYLADENDRYGWGFSTSRKVLEEKIEELIKVEYLTDENGERVFDENGEPIIINNGGGGFSYGDWEFTYHKVTKEEADLVMSLMEGAKPGSYMEEEFLNIISEEAEPFFQGQKSVDEVTGIIQSRIQLYMNENR